MNKTFNCIYKLIRELSYIQNIQIKKYATMKKNEKKIWQSDFLRVILS